MNTLRENLKNAKNGIDKKDIKLEIVDVKQKMLLLEKKIIANEKKKMLQKKEKLNSATARKCRNHGLICIGLGVIYKQNKIQEFEENCEQGKEAIREWASKNYGYDKDKMK